MKRAFGQREKDIAKLQMRNFAISFFGSKESTIPTDDIFPSSN